MDFFTSMFIALLKYLIIASAILTVSSRNPIYSVLLLVFTFLNTTILLLFYKVEYFSILLILVYLGAIAVLFLFDVMLINIKIFEITERAMMFVSFGFIIVLVYYLLCLIILDTLNGKAAMLVFQLPKWVDIVYQGDNILSLASFMFTQGFLFVIISSLVLLVAVIGSIFLTLVRSKRLKIQDEFSQILRENRTSVKLKH